MALSRYPNTALQITKWPVGLFALALLPGSCMAMVGLVKRVTDNPAPIAWFGAGAGAYVFLWLVLFRRRFMGSFFSTFEHELTHAIFAWLTLHKVVGLKATWNAGGEVAYEGRGNWLISIAPYWFPTLCIPFLVMSTLGRFDGQLWVAVALGATFAYHLTSTYIETHSQQTDLQKTTMLFAWVFLPTANIVSAGFIIAFAHEGAAAATLFLNTVWQDTATLLGYFQR
jgi:hypothetical protein